MYLTILYDTQQHSKDHYLYSVNMTNLLGKHQTDCSPLLKLRTLLNIMPQPATKIWD